MILLLIPILLAVIVLVGCTVRGGFHLLDWLIFPFGPKGHRTPRWLWLLLVAVLLSAVIHLQNHPV